jgi:hypothetical protein
VSVRLRRAQIVNPDDLNFIAAAVQYPHYRPADSSKTIDTYLNGCHLS